MFSGIIEETQQINSVKKQAEDLIIGLCPTFRAECSLGQSIAIQGVCLTVFEINKDILFYLSPETMDKTNKHYWQLGQTVNLERSLCLGSRIDGHLVSGHVDGCVIIDAIQQLGDAYEVIFRYADNSQKKLIYPKGSIAIDGISLTINEVMKDTFKVMIIPHTWHHTNAQFWQVGHKVHVEFDSLAKMIDHQLTLRNKI